MGHLMMENRHGLIFDAMLTPASGTAERATAETMLALSADLAEIVRLNFSTANTDADVDSPDEMRLLKAA